MFAQDKEIVVAVITITCLLIVLVGIIVAAVVQYQSRARKHLQEVSNLKILYQEEAIKAQIEKEEQILTRISQEIHDNIGQILSLAKLNLNTLNLDNCDPEIRSKALSTKDLVGKAINDLRQLSKSLNSIHLSQNSLSQSLKLEADIINKIGLFNLKFETNGDEAVFEPQKQLIIFRIAQEALNNIIKHAHAHNISVCLDYNGKFLKFTIEDDGVGFNVSDAALENQKGTGVGNMVHRARLIGANIEINSVKGRGTIVQLIVPIE